MSAPVKTTDLGLASYLYALGHKLTVSEVTPTQRQFTFPPEAATDEQAYFGGVSVNARLFFAAIRDVKVMVHRPIPRSTDSISMNEVRNER